MRLWHYGIGFTFALGFGVSFGLGCSAAGKPTGTTSGGGEGGGSGGAGGIGGMITVGPGPGAGGLDAGGSDGFGECAKFSAEAKQAPAAMLLVLDRTASMSNSNKWGTAQISIVQAIDNDAFDTMSLGMLTFPSPNAVAGPQCIFGLPIYCDVSALPQVPIKAAGTDKSSDATGVRHQIYDYLVNNGPEGADSSDSSPIYAALNGAYGFIKTVQNVDKRIVVLITDGGGSCTSVSNPQRPAYVDNNGCQDWEEPPIMAKLISDAHADPATPINTFVVGVPGSNSNGSPVGGIDTPPYHMLLALSTYAVAGSPETLDPACDQATAFTQGGPDPAKPCHIDLSNGNNFNANALADAITSIRGKALGCTYDLPPPPPGQMTDLTLVNVNVTVNGATATVPKRSMPTDDCKTDGCWDYNKKNQVQLIGKTCADVSAAQKAKVEIFVGCMTVVK
jgi:hypothetical protein